MPEVLCWLWRDYPQPIVGGRGPQRRTDILIEGADWELVSAGHKFTEGPVGELPRCSGVAVPLAGIMERSTLMRGRFFYRLRGMCR